MDNNFSVAPRDFGQIQPVRAWRAGWLYQGEAVISERWSTDFSAPLIGSASFRVVLLTTPAAVDAASLEDHRIGVWIAGQGVANIGVVGGPFDGILQDFDGLGRSLALEQHDPEVFQDSDVIGRQRASIAQGLDAVREISESVQEQP